MGIIITSSVKVEEYILDRCIDLTGRNLELMKHEDDSQLAVIDSDTREVLFSSRPGMGWTGGVSFIGAYSEWCEHNGYDPF